MDKKIIRILDQIDKYQPKITNTCLWINCQSAAISSHSHSEKYLRKIASSNTVYGLTKSSVNHAKGNFFKRFGVQQASTFSGFCQAHDSQLFSPIETCTLISNSRENAFLLFMRSLFFEYHQKIFVKKRIIRFKKLCHEQKISIKNELIEEFIDGKDEFIKYDFPYYSGEIFKLYQAKSYDDINSIYIRLSKMATICVTTMICPLFDDYKGQGNIQPLFSFNVIPDGDSSLVSISWFKNDDAHMRKIIDLAKDDTNKLLNYLIFMETENYYFSHGFYESCIKKETDYIVRALHNRSYGMGYNDVKILYKFIDDNVESIFNL